MVVFFSSRRRHTRFDCDWSSDVCSSDLTNNLAAASNGVGPATLKEAAARLFVTSTVPRTTFVIVTSISSTSQPGRSEERRVGKECQSGWQLSRANTNSQLIEHAHQLARQ